MSRRALYFFPHNLYPPKTGAHHRAIEMLAGLRDLGYQVTLASSTLSSESEWTAASVLGLVSGCVQRVQVYPTSQWDNRYLRMVRRYLLQFRLQPTVDSSLYTPPGMRRWFGRLMDREEPDLVVMNYAFWDGLIHHTRYAHVHQVIDYLDLVTLNMAMQAELRKVMFSLSQDADALDAALEEDYWERLALRPDPLEYQVFDRYHDTIAISAAEAALVRENTHKTHVTFIPVTYEPRSIENRYDGAALFPVGPNPFNNQGYLYFTRKVLPQVRRALPEFALDVTGWYYYNTPFEPAPGVAVGGFVPDLTQAYESARFVICPVLGGTGQQIKIVEAMAHGVPVIAIRPAAERSPLCHEVNGLVACNAAEFAEQVVRLWRDPALCRRLGQAARETIAAEYSRDRWRDALGAVVLRSPGSGAR